ncbi:MULTISPECIES: hypothetical protein [Bradyrhizobium]
MIILGPPLILLVIGLFCWLAFMLAASALPVFVGMTIAMLSFHTGAGLLGCGAIGLVAGGLTFGVTWLALALAPWALVRLLIILLYVAPATVAGYSATYGNALMAAPSPIWQTVFAVMGAIAVSITAFIRFTGMAALDLPGNGSVH